MQHRSNPIIYLEIVLLIIFLVTILLNWNISEINAIHNIVKYLLVSEYILCKHHHQPDTLPPFLVDPTTSIP